MGEFSPPIFLSPLLLLLFFSYPSNIEIIFDFSDIITNIQPSFQNPGSALGNKRCHSTCFGAQEDQSVTIGVLKSKKINVAGQGQLKHLNI